MAADSVRSIYQQYKYDTDVVASWLATTAKAFGYAEPLGPQAVETKGPGRLKGKARKQAKQASAAAASTNGASQKKTKYTLAIKDFVPLARHIAGRKDASINVPNYFTTALERVIWVRSSFSKKLSAAGKRLDEASDERHSFFVTVLEKVHDSLKPLLEASVSNFTAFKNGVPKDHVKSNDRARNTPLRNLFEVLDVYEPSADFLRAPNVAPPKREELECTVELSEEDSFVEAIFAVTMLINDLSRMRAEIAELWAKYSAGTMDLTAVSVATNTAIELARAMQAEVQPLIDQCGGTTLFHEAFFAGLCQAIGIDGLAKQQFSDDYNYVAYDIADALFLNARNGLHVFIANVRPHDMPDYNGKWGWFDETSVRATLPNRNKYNRDKATLQEVLQELVHVRACAEPIQDHLQRGLLETQTATKHAGGEPVVPFWLSFAAQLYLDILYSVQVCIFRPRKIYSC